MNHSNESFSQSSIFFISQRASSTRVPAGLDFSIRFLSRSILSAGNWLNCELNGRLSPPLAGWQIGRIVSRPRAPYKGGWGYGVSSSYVLFTLGAPCTGDGVMEFPVPYVLYLFTLRAPYA